MPSLHTYIIFMLLFILLSFSSEAAATYSSHACDNSTTFTPNSTYQANIKTLLSSLSSNISNSKNGFYNTTAGQDPNLVYGTFLCRGDVSANRCQDCVASASNEIAQRCLTEKMGVIWYDECTVRYSDQNIFSIIREVPGMDNSSSASIRDKESFDQLLASVMKILANRAAYEDQSGKKFAAGEANFTSSQTLYSLVQCTPDLTDALCFRCFQSAIATLPTCCDGKQGARVLLPSCNIRYETFPFYYLNGTGNTVLVPLPSSPNTTKEKTKTPTKTVIAIAVPVVVSVVLFAAGFCLLTRNRKKYDAVDQENAAKEIATEESLQFDFSTIEAATNKFSDDNKLGEGGFGPVYKGKLPDGQEIAVKRLSVRSSQGAAEYKNEVALVAKLQHRNLVRLLGFCFQGAEKLLIYEFVPNKSLDYFLFDLERQGQLNWTKRYKIIEGIARGILYLHEDSRLKIIHRDLKTSNILLDENMNSKISDFGLARIFGVDQSEGSTSRIVGTYGYMPPEYAMHGHFSVKSDVYSFGVIILEIITGKKNNNFQSTDGAEDLLSYAWKHWNNGTPLELLDPSLRSSYSRNEVNRCIHIGLLCVQEDPTGRPTMAAIVLMLNSYSITLQAPRPPATFLIPTSELNFPTNEEWSDQSASKSIPFSVNEASISDIYHR